MRARRVLNSVLKQASLLQHRIEEAESEENDNNWFDELIRTQLRVGDLALKLHDQALFGINKEGISPLSWAAITGFEAIVRLLLDKGADVKARIAGGWTPLLLAAYKGQYGIVKLLLEKGADPRARNEKGATALQCAQDQQHASVVELLRARGSKPAFLPGPSSGSDPFEPNPKEQDKLANTSRQPHDLEFATEISTSLLSQVRSL